MWIPMTRIRGSWLILALAALPLTASAQDIVRSASTVPSFIGYRSDAFVVAFRRETAHQLDALPSEVNRARACFSPRRWAAPPGPTHGHSPAFFPFDL